MINNEVYRELINELVTKNARLFNLQLKNRREEPFILCEEYHLSTEVNNGLYCWELQETIGITENNKIHMMMFLHPIIVSAATRREYIEFANAANIWLGSALGRFCVNHDNDFYYECFLTDLLIDHLEELEQQLFDKPFSHFKDCLTPLLMLKDGNWTAEKAIEYLDELRTEGFVDNSKYGLL